MTMINIDKMRFVTNLDRDRKAIKYMNRQTDRLTQGQSKKGGKGLPQLYKNLKGGEVIEMHNIYPCDPVPV